MKIHLLSGFLGSGKTTAIQAACAALIHDGLKPAVITNDQGSRLVDNDFFTSLDIAGRQVTNGCFCCNYNQLDAQMRSLQEEEHPDVIFAESVGSCTDIVATVLKPLRKYRSESATTLSVLTDVRLLGILLNATSPVFEESVSYIYFKQVEEAAIVILNKIDLVNAEELDVITAEMKKRYPAKTFLHQNSFDPASVRAWLNALDLESAVQPLASLNIDYDIYGAGEALLAWLDEDVEIRSQQSNAPGCAWALIQAIHKKIAAQKYPIGHLKFLVNNEHKISFVQGQPDPVPSLPKQEKGDVVSLLINARVQTDPDTLASIIRDSIAETQASMRCAISINTLSSFQPGYPRPTHRITD